MATTTTSKTGTLNWRDLLKGLLLTVISAVLTALLPLIQAGNYKLNWEMIITVASITGISYLLKNLGSPAEIVVTNATKETVAAVKDGTAQVNIQNKTS